MHVPAISGLVLLASFAVSSSSGQAAAAAPPPAATGASVTVDVDLNRSLGPYRVQRWFGYDEENYTTAPNGRKLLGELHDLSPTPV